MVSDLFVGVRSRLVRVTCWRPSCYSACCSEGIWGWMLSQGSCSLPLATRGET